LVNACKFYCNNCDVCGRGFGFLLPETALTANRQAGRALWEVVYSARWFGRVWFRKLDVGLHVHGSVHHHS
jgi:hypothetical protein